MRRPFRVGDRVVDKDTPARVGTVIKPVSGRRDMWVRFDYQSKLYYTVVGKDYMIFSPHPLDRLVNEV